VVSKQLEQALEFAKTLRDDQVIDFLLEQQLDLENLFAKWKEAAE
jgi:hypothetical protein